MSQQGGFGGFGGFGPSGGYSPNALIQHRDGIVGTWTPQTAALPQLPCDDLANLKLWEPWVRAELIDFDLMSKLQFGFDSTSKECTLWHVDPGPPSTTPVTVACQPVATLIRPPDSASFWLAQLDIVNNWADLRQERAEEIVTQLAPPVAYWSTILNLHPERRKWTLEVLGAALRLANYAEMRFKHALACRRPIEYSPQVQPMILTPGHGSLPSGHATEAFIVAFVLWRLVKDTLGGSSNVAWLEQLMRQAARVAINRTIAGVHFPVDSAAGQLLGLTLGGYFVCRATDAGQYEAWKFDGTQFDNNADFEWRLQYDVPNDKQRQAPSTAPYFATSLTLQSGVTLAPMLAQLWSAAEEEWK